LEFQIRPKVSVASSPLWLGFPVLVLVMKVLKVGENMKSSAVRLLALSLLLLTLFAVGAYADSVNLGTAGSYAVLAGSTVTNTGPTVLNGDLGLSPGTSVTGFFPQGPGIVNGTINVANGAAEQAQDDLTTAYKQAKGLSRTATLTGKDLGGRVLTPGVYFFATSAQLTGHLTLEGTPGALFVFQVGSTLTTASASSVIFINSLNGHQMKDPNIFWQVGSSATLGTTTAFEGNILALTSISLNTGATITCGSALARNGAVTLQGNTITTCANTVSTVPEPGTMGLMGTGLAILAGAVRRKMRI
jgi:Ice-binding-like/PEP-CTERM motif